jgi:hypothetical protein
MSKRSARRNRGREKQRLRDLVGRVILPSNWGNLIEIVHFHTVRRTMNIPVIYEDEEENEFEIELCCDVCALNYYGWTAAQFQKVLDSADKGMPIKVPGKIKSEATLKEFVKSL